MNQKRDRILAEARQRKAAAQKIVLDKIATARLGGTRAVEKARLILADGGFVDLLCAQGIQTLPRCLVERRDFPAHGEKGPSVQEGNQADSLDFVVAWAFMFPLFSKPEILNYLEAMWPGFIMEMKDAFIAQVIEGPFPYAMSGDVSWVLKGDQYLVSSNNS
jgi:hypothetical protein